MTQQEIGRRAGVERGYIAKIEGGHANPSIAVVARIAAALQMDAELILRPPVILGGTSQRDLVHARCSGQVDRRLRMMGLQTVREVEIVHARSHGWIDLLAFEPSTSTLLIIEIKTRIDDLGAIERQLGWYERSAPVVARGLTWRPRHVRTWLLALASEEVEGAIRENRSILETQFPVRAQAAQTWLSVGGPPPPGRLLALIDPGSRRRDWLIRSRIDGRRSMAPYRDYRDAAAARSRI